MCYTALCTHVIGTFSWYIARARSGMEQCFMNPSPEGIAAAAVSHISLRSHRRPGTVSTGGAAAWATRGP